MEGYARWKLHAVQNALQHYTRPHVFNLDKIAVSTSSKACNLFLFCLGAFLDFNVSLGMDVSRELEGSVELKTQKIIIRSRLLDF